MNQIHPEYFLFGNVNIYRKCAKYFQMCGETDTWNQYIADNAFWLTATGGGYIMHICLMSAVTDDF